MPEFITVSDGRVLPLRVGAYEAVRLGGANSTVKAICNAPFVSLDFGPRGSVALCNHIFAAVAAVTPETGVLEIWRGTEMQRLRENFQRYCLEPGCVHCIHQIETGHARETFAQQHFDQHPVQPQDWAYPKRLIFRLNSTCNLACIMCDGETSSRVRKERDGLPAYPSAYGEPFFRDMEEILPHVEYVEFYGGEPFLVAEHLRIMEMMLQLRCKASIFVNTNTVAFSNNAKKYIERLNIHRIAVSMDAFHAQVHEAVRIGLDHKQFIANLEWLLEVGQRRGFTVYLNVTEHRKNWFDLPNLFRFADEKKLYIHVNHCIAPDNVTLYNLPEQELKYVLDYWRAEYDRLYGANPGRTNRIAYEHLMSLAAGELKRRTGGWQVLQNWSNLASDGKLAVPLIGLPPFDWPDRVSAEIARIRGLPPERALPMLREFSAGIEAEARKSSSPGKWGAAASLCREAIDGVSDHAAPTAALV